MFSSRPASVSNRLMVVLLGLGTLAHFTQGHTQEGSPSADAPATTAPDKATIDTASTRGEAAASSTAAPANPAPSSAAPNLPANVGPRPAADKVVADVTTGVEVGESPPATPAIPDPLLAPLEEPPVPTDLVSGGIEPTPTESVVVNLINRLVERGVLTQGDAAELVSQAQRDAAVATQNASAAALVAADAAMASEEDIVVTHIPDSVKDRLREEIREEIVADLPPPTHFIYSDDYPENGKEAVVGELEEIPSWVRNIRVFGDFRVRYDTTLFPDGNDATGSFPNFNRINSGAPFDVAGFEFSPQLNVDETRQRFRLRARAGFHADIGDGFTIGFRGATGNDNSPVSTNQTLGANFQKYAIWADQAFVRWDGVVGSAVASISAGRFENPFFRTSDIIWDTDVVFDGFTFKATPDVSENLRPFLTAGVFPLFNTGFNFPNNQPDKFKSTDRYLYGAQGGIDFDATREIGVKFAIGYLDFDDIEGRLSDPFVPLSPNDAGSTDDLRPPFAQKGNTYMALRNITPDALNNFGTTDQYQYFGLASAFEVLTYTGRIDLNHWEPFQISLLGEYAMNLGFDESEIAQEALNNRGPVPAPGVPGQYEGGNVAWNAGVQFGKPVLDKRWDMNTVLGYRYIESDAVVDAFNDSDFGLGGTNMEGFSISTKIALTSNTNFQIEWMSANEIAGPPLQTDFFTFDFNASF